MFESIRELINEADQIGEAKETKVRYGHEVQPGQKVRVDKPISKTEKELLGRVFKVDRITKPHGYAVIKDQHGAWHVHHEALTILESTNLTESREIADTIVQQFGGYGKLKAMLGARDFVYGKNYLTFKFPNKKRNAPNCIKIEYILGKDLYNLEFKRISKLDVKDIKSVDDVYADQLKPIFEKETGLYLSL